MKRIACLWIAVLLLVCVLALPALAAGELVSINGNTYYDERENRFVYYASTAEDITVYCSAADGMITTKPVTIRSEAMTALEIYRNGNKLENISSGSYQTVGEYVIMYVGGSVPERLFSFTIADKLTNSVTGYSMPAGFVITEVTLDGQSIDFQKNHVSMLEEGQYDIRYRCIKNDITYQLQLQADYTGPTLALEQVKDGVARGPVDISDYKAAETVSIYLNGEKISNTEVLKGSGEYYIELADKAGNKTTYSFTIMIYFDGNSWLFIAIVVLAAAGTAGYLLHARKHLRVR